MMQARFDSLKAVKGSLSTLRVLVYHEGYRSLFMQACSLRSSYILGRRTTRTIYFAVSVVVLQIKKNLSVLSRFSL